MGHLLPLIVISGENYISSRQFWPLTWCVSDADCKYCFVIRLVVNSKRWVFPVFQVPLKRQFNTASLKTEETTPENTIKLKNIRWSDRHKIISFREVIESREVARSLIKEERNRVVQENQQRVSVNFGLSDYWEVGHHISDYLLIAEFHKQS